MRIALLTQESYEVLKNSLCTIKSKNYQDTVEIKIFSNVIYPGFFVLYDAMLCYVML